MIVRQKIIQLRHAEHRFRETVFVAHAVPAKSQETAVWLIGGGISAGC